MSALEGHPAYVKDELSRLLAKLAAGERARLVLVDLRRRRRSRILRESAARAYPLGATVLEENALIESDLHRLLVVYAESLVARQPRLERGRERGPAIQEIELLVTRLGRFRSQYEHPELRRGGRYRHSALLLLAAMTVLCRRYGRSLLLLLDNAQALPQRDLSFLLQLQAEAEERDAAFGLVLAGTPSLSARLERLGDESPVYRLFGPL